MDDILYGYFHVRIGKGISLFFDGLLQRILTFLLDTSGQLADHIVVGIDGQQFFVPVFDVLQFFPGSHPLCFPFLFFFIFLFIIKFHVDGFRRLLLFFALFLRFRGEFLFDFFFGSFLLELADVFPELFRIAFLFQQVAHVRGRGAV